MIDNEHVENLNETGKWLVDKAKELVREVEQKKRISKKLTRRFLEINARMKQFQNDMKKVTDEGEEWKNEN